jgi:hypothetical protein
MKNYALFDATGRVRQVCNSPDAESLQPILDATGFSALELPEDMRVTGEAWVDSGQLCHVPPAPSGSCDWDWTVKAWVPNLAKAKADQHARIERERDRRIAAPVIVYDGKNLDARDEDIRNLEKKLAAVQSRIDTQTETPAQSLVWKDYDNQVHVFADLTTYKAWLDGFAIALDERAMTAWAWSWQKKAQLEAITDPAELDAFDPTA